jgi:hypothetical protein
MPFLKYLSRSSPSQQSGGKDGKLISRHAPVAASPQKPSRRKARRGSLLAQTWGDNGDEHDEFEGTLDEQTLRQENQRLQLQLEQQQEHCEHLETKFHGTRDELAYNNASWIDQLHSVQGQYQTQIFQQQRQAESVGNAILEQELEEWRRIQHEVSDTLVNSKDHTAKLEQEIKCLQAEVQKWRDRHANTEEQSEDWYEERKTKLVPRDLQGGSRMFQNGEEGEEPPESTSPVAIVVQPQQRSQQLENGQLKHARTVELEAKVLECEQTIRELQQEKDIEEAMQSRQLMEWKDRAKRYQAELEKLQGRQVKQEELEDASRAEWTAQVTELETENHELEQRLLRREQHWNHERGRQDRAFQALEEKLAETSLRESTLRDQLSVIRNSDKRDPLFDLDNTVATEDSTFWPEDDSSPIDNDIVSQREDTSYKNNKQLESRLEQSPTRERDLDEQLEDLMLAAAMAQEKSHDAEGRADKQLEDLMLAAAMEQEKSQDAEGRADVL